MASPSAVSWMSTSMAKLPDIAACTAPGMFSTIPRETSCRPRWATGRAVSQAGARIGSGHLEDGLDLDRRIGWQRGHADGGAGMTTLVAEGCDHQVGGAVQHLWPVEEIGRGIDETAEPDHPGDLVEIAERRLHLRQQIHRATLGRGIALLDGDAGAELTLGDQPAVGIHADLARYEQQIARAHEGHIIRDGASRFGESDAFRRQFLLDRTRHVPSPKMNALLSERSASEGHLVSRRMVRHASDGWLPGCTRFWLQNLHFRDAAPVAAQ